MKVESYLSEDIIDKSRWNDATIVSLDILMLFLVEFLVVVVVVVVVVLLLFASLPFSWILSRCSCASGSSGGCVALSFVVVTAEDDVDDGDMMGVVMPYGLWYIYNLLHRCE